MKLLIDKIKKFVMYDNIYCHYLCRYKNHTRCNLFNKETKYNWNKDLAKRLPLCIEYFGRKK